MPHNTKQLICHWYLDGFKPESEYYHDLIQHFKPAELAEIASFIARQYNSDARFTLREKLRVIYYLTIAILKSRAGDGEEEYEHGE